MSSGSEYDSSDEEDFTAEHDQGSELDETEEEPDEFDTNLPFPTRIPRQRMRDELFEYKQYDPPDFLKSRKSLKDTYARLDDIKTAVMGLRRSIKEAGVNIPKKEYEGFGSSAHSKYAMMRLMFDEFFREFGDFAVLHVSFNHRSDMQERRFSWTNGHLFSKNRPGFIFLNESHMMSMRIDAKSQVVIRDTNKMVIQDGFWEFLYRSKIFGSAKLVLDEMTPQQGMGQGGCGVMSMVNALLPGGMYATAEDGEVLKLPFIECIFAAMQQRRCSPYTLASMDWRHESLGLIKRGDRKDAPEQFAYYEVNHYNREEVERDEDWSHFARFRLHEWLPHSMQYFYSNTVNDVMAMYFLEIYERDQHAAIDVDLDDRRVYRQLWPMMNLVERAICQKRAYSDVSDSFDREEEEGASPRVRGVYRYPGRAMEHYCTRITKLAPQDQLHFAKILGHAWISRLQLEVFDNPYCEAAGIVPLHALDHVSRKDEMYANIDAELTFHENMMRAIIETSLDVEDE
jgi:hypothetical protein